MQIIDYVLMRRPGSVRKELEKIEITHDYGGVSTFWLRQSRSPLPDPLDKLADLYQLYDGIDLFSSTFKVASVHDRKSKNGIDITFTLSDLQAELSTYMHKKAAGKTPFMLQQGIGIYYLNDNEDGIYEWDTELSEITGKYSGVIDVIGEWCDALD